MGNRVQPGGRVDKDVYERFREYVRETHGSVRGNLGTELENAMRDRMNAANGTDQLTRIENDVATLKAALAEAEGDGGTTLRTPSDDGDTHARQSRKPSSNQPRSKKVAYLIDVVLDDPARSRDSGSVSTKRLRDIVQDEYGFKDETADEYVELIADELDAIEHPKYPMERIWGERIPEVREELRDEVASEMDSLE